MKRPLPWVLLFGFGLVLLGASAVLSAPSDGDVPVEGFCDGGRLVALRVHAPKAGVITVPIPPDVCVGTQPAPARQPARST